METTIGDRLALVRGSVSQKEFANSLGVHKNTLGLYERNDRAPDANLLRLLLEGHGININWLLTGSGSMYISHQEAQQTPVAAPAGMSALADRLRSTSATWAQAVEAAGYEPPSNVAENIKTAIFEGGLNVETVARLIIALKEATL